MSDPWHGGPGVALNTHPDYTRGAASGAAVTFGHPYDRIRHCSIDGLLLRVQIDPVAVGRCRRCGQPITAADIAYPQRDTP